MSYSHSTQPLHLHAITTPRPWPILTRLRIGRFLLSNIALWNLKIYAGIITSTLGLLLITFTWRRDLRRESNFLGSHTLKTQASLKLGIILFIFREVILFFRFFWTFFHFALNPVGDIGLVWPPTGIHRLNAFRIPIINTIILVSSGLTLTLSHHLLLINSKSAIQWLALTLFLGVTFTLLQAFEYYQASFSIIRANYGSIFFLATGFHGGHVLAGSTLLLISLIKLTQEKYSLWHHFRFEASIWYWHFVDVVWLFLYTFVYWWGA